MKNSVRNAKPSKNAAPKPVTPPTVKPETKGSAVQVVESGSCPSLSGSSTIGYDVGRDVENAVYLRIRSSSGGGKFSRDWMPLAEVMEALGKAEGPITSAALRTVCRRKSQNQQGYALAYCAHRGLVQRLPNKLRGFALGPNFQAGAKQLNLRDATKASASATKPLRGKATAKAKSK